MICLSYWDSFVIVMGKISTTELIRWQDFFKLYLLYSTTKLILNLRWVWGFFFLLILFSGQKIHYANLKEKRKKKFVEGSQSELRKLFLIKSDFHWFFFFIFHNYTLAVASCNIIVERSIMSMNDQCEFAIWKSQKNVCFVFGRAYFTLYAMINKYSLFIDRNLRLRGILLFVNNASYKLVRLTAII